MTDFHALRSITRPLIAVALALIGVTAVAGSSAARPEAPRDGQIHQTSTGAEVWDARADAWVDPESFWLAYAEQSRGRFWGRTDTYPAYDEVNEHDTILVEVDEGACLMYFFHRRWRRAEDVRRWDPVFNRIAGCPHVFD